ncbi:uncharacterized protein LOC133319138 isoform X1 [Danaus plexippus]|uniref:uncharacterized protein LOC133319138 isoform X1 n=1 Tax=Danaus plexippus TaxID=13037 RepID=UPI002AB1F384|nr:uncharacterized protein LOC133319138 isoform X1 [Danaus plexippus]
MYIANVIYVFIFIKYSTVNGENEETDLYYYGLEESERSLPRCEDGEACSVLLRRYWRPPALVRLCRCSRRTRCDKIASGDRLVELNNRSDLQFCNPVTEWPECSINEAPLKIETAYERMSPDEIELLHRQSIQLAPPRIRLRCLCPKPNYWKLKTEDSDTNLTYRCSSLPLCKTGDVCGNVDDVLLSLYQSCLCPKNHICVHSGGRTQIQISEPLYRGRGWRARCQALSDEDSYEDY